MPVPTVATEAARERDRVRILDLTDLTGRPVPDFGSEGFSVAGLARGTDTHVVVLALEPGGIIGRHPAVVRQLLLLVAGDALVSGDDGVLVGSPSDTQPSGIRARATRRGARPG